MPATVIPVVDSVERPSDTVEKVARELDVDPSQVRRWARAGLIAALAIGNTLLIDRASWQHFKQQRETTRDPGAKRRGRPRKVGREESPE